MNGLFVSIAFPPKNDPECIQVARIFKFLSKVNEVSWDVITSKSPTLFMPDDVTLTNLDSGYNMKICIPIYESRLSSFVFRKLKFDNFLLFPDGKMTFYWQWKKAIRQITRKPDFIYSRSNPMSSAFMASKIKAYYQIPWVMHLSDPWALSPLHKNKSKRFYKYELKLIETADHVTFTSEGTFDLYVDHYKQFRHKFSVFPNVYDPADYIPESVGHSEKFRIIYTGGIAGKRSVFFMKDVLTYMEHSQQGILNDVEIIFAGDIDRVNKTFFESSQFKCVRHVGMVSYAEAKKLQRSAHILMAVDNPTEAAGAIFFPSKLLDYFMAGRKVLAITPEDSTSRQVLKHYPSTCFQHTETAKIAAFLIEQINQYRLHNYAFFEVKTIPPQFSALQNSGKLLQIFHDLTRQTR
jgi:glycosyltransferase involved in cell wall biosynthesis